MKRAQIAAAGCAATFIFASPCFADEPKQNLVDAIIEAQHYGGGTVLEVNQNKPDAPQKFSAVVIDPNGVLNHFSYNLPVGTLWPAKPVSPAQFSRAMNDVSEAKVMMPDAVRTAEQTAGGTAVAAEFVAAPRVHVVGYKVDVANTAGQLQTVVIDAKTGAPIPNADRLNLTT